MHVYRTTQPDTVIDQGKLLLKQGRPYLRLASSGGLDRLILGFAPLPHARQALITSDELLEISREDWLAFAQAQQQPLCCPTCGSTNLRPVSVLDVTAYRCDACGADMIPGPVLATEDEGGEG